MRHWPFILAWTTLCLVELWVIEWSYGYPAETWTLCVMFAVMFAGTFVLDTVILPAIERRRAKRGTP